jgi:SRSO17 transposase
MRATVRVLKAAQDLPHSAYQTIAWREGANRLLSSRFAAMRGRAGHRYYGRSGLPGRMVADRVAREGTGTHKILALQP